MHVATLADDVIWVTRTTSVAVGNHRHVRFSNRPFEVKHFQTIHRCSVDVARGLALLSGIGTKAVPSWDPRRRWNNLCRDLTVN